MGTRFRRVSWVGCLWLLCLMTGCGKSDTPDLGEVSGTIKLDGQPLAGALVEFTPVKGRGSVATTDAEGHYTLKYTNDLNGAVLGSHTVRISTGKPASSGEGGQGQKAIPERIPPEYNSRSDKQVEVKAGSQTYDYDIKTGGQTFPTIGEGGAKAPTA